MKDLISKSALLDWLAPFEDMEKVGMPQIIEVIQSRPTVEAAPMVHGRWIEESGIQICSNCGEEHEWEDYRASYCEDCGCRMDGESNG